MHNVHRHTLLVLVILLLALALSSCQSQAAPEGPWSVTFKVSRNPGTSGQSGGSVKVSSDGAVESTSWQSGIAPSEPSVTKSKLSPEALAALAQALSDPGLVDPALDKGAGPAELTYTVNGKTITVLSTTDTFPGAPGLLVAALAKAVGPLPILHRDHP